MKSSFWPCSESLSIDLHLKLWAALIYKRASSHSSCISLNFFVSFFHLLIQTEGKTNKTDAAETNHLFQSPHLKCNILIRTLTFLQEITVV